MSGPVGVAEIWKGNAMRRWFTKAAAGVTVLFVLALLGYAGPSVAAAKAATPAVAVAKSVAPTPQFAVLHTAKLGFSANTSGPPTWTYSYLYQSHTYSDLMVGTNPKTGTSTTISTYIIPIKLTYGTTVADPLAPVTGSSLNVVQSTIASPVFTSGVDFVQGGTDVGNTQYIDAFQRAAFWHKVSTRPGYHVLLGTPTVEPEQSYTIPSTKGSLGSAFGVSVILANINWFDAKAQSLLTSLAIPANALPIFVITQTYLSSNSGASGCCIGGYHNYNGTQAYAAYTYIQKAGAFSQDVSALSHEVGEYVDDPDTNNTDVPASCGTHGNDTLIYEVGDPLEVEANYGDYPYKLAGVTYHLQDLVTPVYFGAKTSTSVNGWSTFQGTTIGVCAEGG